MAAGDLLFGRPPATDGHLLFDEGPDGVAIARISAALPALTASVELSATTGDVECQISGALPVLTASVVASVDIAIPEYVTASAGLPWHAAVGNARRAETPWPATDPLSDGWRAPWRAATPAATGFEAPWQDSVSIAKPVGPISWRDATAAVHPVSAPWDTGQPLIGESAREPWRDTTSLARSTAEPWKNAVSSARIAREPWRQGNTLLRIARTPWGLGLVVNASTREPWRDGIPLQSHGGPRIEPPPEPPEEPCYTPDADLLFALGGPVTPFLLFYCENHPPEPGATVVVPIRKVYAVLDSFLLKRVVDDVYLPALSASLTLDRDSWTWGATFSLPAAELPQVEADGDGVPVELEATINGAAYRFLAERVGRDRQFPSGRISVSCRGLGGELDLLQGNYDNSAAARTAAQLLDDILEVNGVGVGWTVDFGLEDWLVPAGAWAHSGTAVSALQAVVTAGGGYLQPHETDRVLRVLPAYPTMPWDWAGVTPDYELPSSVITRESIEWTEKPRYNRVFVSGQNVGVLCQVTRTGSAGDVVAPQVVDPLIVTTAAGRQRGGVVLGDTGRQALVRLSLPILPATGIIPPGKFVRYVDGAEVRLGITRSVSVDVKLAGSRQTIGIETHVESV